MSTEIFETVIVGGGIAGIGLAYYMASNGETSILVLEGNELASGCTSGSLGGVRQQFSTALEVELALRGRRFWRDFEEDFDYPCTYYQDGYLLVTGKQETYKALELAAEVQRAAGAPDVEMIPASRIKEVAPWLSPDGLIGGSYTPLDGRFNPTDGLYGMAKAAKKLGVTIREQTKVQSIERGVGGWQLLASEPIQANRVVIASGLAAPAMAKPFGIDLDITPLWLHCGYTTAIAVGQPMPLMIDLDTGLIIEREGEGACVTVSDPQYGPNGKQKMMEEFAELVEVRAPVFSEVGIRTTTSAPFDATGGDGHAYAGEIENNLWVFAGFDGHGTMQGPAIAEILANHMAGKPDPVIDVKLFDPHRKPMSKEEWIRAAKS